jgi:DNA-binding MarR family transcriptional regulator
VATTAEEIELGTENSLAQQYAEMTRLVERLHRRFLDVLNLELMRAGVEDVNAVQALLLTDIVNEVSVRDLKRRAYHIGSSISYNLKKLLECGYIEQERSTHDRRSVRVRPTGTGQALCETVRRIEAEHADLMFGRDGAAGELSQACDLLARIEESWSAKIQMGQLRPV